MKKQIQIICEDGTVQGTKVLDAEGNPLAYVTKIEMVFDAKQTYPEVVIHMLAKDLGLDIKAEAEIKSLMEGKVVGEYLQGPYSSLPPGKLAEGCKGCFREDVCRPMDIAERFVCDACGKQFLVDGESGVAFEVTNDVECAVTPREGLVYCDNCRHDDEED